MLTYMKKKSGRHPFSYFVLLFFSLSCVGWLWEGALYLVTQHTWINRGVCRGPYLPVYGSGGILLYLLLRPLRKKPIWLFMLSMAGCSALEYLTGYFLELQWGIRWWDYSGHFLNINGRICLLGAVLFGVGGVALFSVFLPIYEHIYEKLSFGWRRWLCLIFLAVFVADAAYCAMYPNTGTGITMLCNTAYTFIC